LAGQLAHAAGVIRAVHADVDPGKPHGLARGRHAGDVAELGQQGQRDQLTDAELVISAWQPDLMSCDRRSERSILAIWCSRASIMPSATVTRSRGSAGRSSLARNSRPVGPQISPGAPGAQPAVIQDRADPQEPLGAFIDQRFRRCSRDRHWRTCSGAIHASGSRPSAKSSRSHNAS